MVLSRDQTINLSLCLSPIPPISQNNLLHKQKSTCCIEEYHWKQNTHTHAHAFSMSGNAGSVNVGRVEVWKREQPSWLCPWDMWVAVTRSTRRRRWFEAFVFYVLFVLLFGKSEQLYCKKPMMPLYVQTPKMLQNTGLWSAVADHPQSCSHAPKFQSKCLFSNPHLFLVPQKNAWAVVI